MTTSNGEPKVVFFSNLAPDLADLVVSHAPPGFSVTSRPASTSEGEQLELVRDADFLLLFPARLSETVFRAASKVKLVQLMSAGYDRLDLSLLNELGVPVANNGGANSVAVAEHTILLILAVYRRLLSYANRVRAGQWRVTEGRGVDTYELEGKTVGLVGIGNIGQQVARRLRGFGTEVQYFDKYANLSSEEEAGLGLRKVELADLFRTSDVVSVHVPLTRETRHLVGEAELATMKPSAIVVNTSRGGIIDEAALHQALINGKIAGAGLDVMEQEPPDPSSPLLALDNVTITPHNAGPTYESLSKRATNSFDNIQRVWRGEPPLWVARFGAA